jgi:hypothetical protein
MTDLRVGAHSGHVTGISNSLGITWSRLTSMENVSSFAELEWRGEVSRV